MAAVHPGDGEIDSLTSIRGIAASWVVLFHFSAVLFGVLPEASFLAPFIQAGHFAVPLFFVLSGYVLGLRYLTKLRSPTATTLLRFWWLRLGRVYPVHLLTLLISLALVARRGWPTDEGHTVWSFIANVLMTHAWQPDFRMTWNYPSWSISSEWFAYLLFPLVALFLARMSRRAAAVLVVVACCLSAGVYAVEPNLVFKGLAVIVPTFVGGVGLAIVCPPGRHRLGGRVAEVGILLAVLLPYVVGPGPTQSAVFLVLFFGMVAALAVAGHQSGWWWRSRQLVFLGEVSYSLYMTHVITITLMTRFFPFDALSRLPMAVRCLAMLVSLFVIVLGAVGMHYAVERPLRNSSRRAIATTKGSNTQGTPS